MGKAFIKLVINLHTFFYRLSGGRFGSALGKNKILLLTTRGRKSGREFTTPLVYMDQEKGYLIIASNGGGRHHPDWYYNLKKDPHAKIQIKDLVLKARAEILDEPTRAPIWTRIVAEAPQYGEYESRTDRLIPVVWLQPAS